MGQNSNHMHVFFDARSKNERFARMAISAFMSGMNPTLEQMADVKTAVSEAVTNAIIHGYQDECKQVEMICNQENGKLTIEIIDHGVGIEDVTYAMEPFFSSKTEFERAGMGFSFMKAFMDEVKVESKLGVGTKVSMVKYIERVDG